MDALLLGLLSETPPAVATLRAWWEATADQRTRWPHTIERALIGGALADRLGFAFASGYSEALRALAPTHAHGITALCATEETGNHPRAIQTRLAPAGPGRYTLTGKKKWGTVASEASALLVVASVGEEAGKNRLRVVKVAANAPGVTLVASAAPFVPEIPHAEVELAGVEVTDADLLPGDGYDDYLKPFRTVEDLHVHGALVGYLIGVARRHAMDRSVIEPLVVLATTVHGLAHANPKSPATHVALAGLITLATRAVEAVEQAWAIPDEEHARWHRDRPLLKVASAARAARRDKAWAELG